MTGAQLPMTPCDLRRALKCITSKVVYGMWCFILEFLDLSWSTSKTVGRLTETESISSNSSRPASSRNGTYAGTRVRRGRSPVARADRCRTVDIGHSRPQWSDAHTGTQDSVAADRQSPRRRPVPRVPCPRRQRARTRSRDRYTCTCTIVTSYHLYYLPARSKTSMYSCTHYYFLNLKQTCYWLCPGMCYVRPYVMLCYSYVRPLLQS